MSILFALISYLGWGSGSFLEAVTARKLSSYSLIFWAHLLSFILLSLYVPFALTDLSKLTLNIFLMVLFLAFLGIFLGGILYYEALKIGNRVTVGTIAASFPVVTVVISLLFLGERVSNQQLVSIIITFMGLFMSIFNFKAIRNKYLLNKAALFALLAMLSWGIYFAFIKIAVVKVGWFWPNYITFFLFPLVLLYTQFRKVRIEAPTKNGALIPLVASTILVRIAELSYNLGISKGLVTVVAPIAGANQTLFVILAFFIFKDPITKQQIIGIVTTLLGIVLLSAFSV